MLSKTKLSLFWYIAVQVGACEFWLGAIVPRTWTYLDGTRLCEIARWRQVCCVFKKLRAEDGGQLFCFASFPGCTCVSFSVTARRVCESMHWTCWETGIPTGLSRAPRLGRERHGMQLVFENQPVNPRSASSKSC